VLPDLNKLEIERIDNLVRNFGWDKIQEQLIDEYIVLTIRKKRVTPIPTGTEGAD